MTYANDCIRQEKIKIPANNLPDCTIISIFEIDDNYYRVFSVCSQLKDQFHYSGRQRENRAMHGSSLAAIWFGHRSWGKQRVRAYFLWRQIVCTMIFILCAIIMLQAGILYRLWQQRRQAELLARNRLRYIEEWLDLLYLYNNDPVSFHTRCKELASVKRLSNRALCVIFRVGKVGSIYVKHHRIKAKIVNVNKSVGGDWDICQILSFSNKTYRVYPVSITDKSSCIIFYFTLLILRRVFSVCYRNRSSEL